MRSKIQFQVTFNNKYIYITCVFLACDFDELQRKSYFFKIYIDKGHSITC